MFFGLGPRKQSGTAQASDATTRTSKLFDKLDGEVHSAASKLQKGHDKHKVYAQLSIAIGKVEQKLRNAPLEQYLADKEQLAQLLDARISIRSLDVDWMKMLSGEVQRLRPAAQQPEYLAPGPQMQTLRTSMAAVPSTAQAAMAQPTMRSTHPIANRQTEAVRQAHNLQGVGADARRDPQKLPSKAPAKSTAQTRLAKAVELTSQVRLKTRSDGSKSLAFLDPKRSGAPDKLKLDLVGVGSIPREPGGPVQSFRVSYVPTQGAGDLIMGSTIHSGGFSKARPGVVIDDQGQQTEVMVKEFRLTQRNEYDGRGAQKSSRNAIGGSISKVMKPEHVRDEIEAATALGGPVKVVAVYELSGKVLMALSRMQNNLAQTQIRSAERSAMARWVGSQLANHSETLHAQGVVHSDGKPENTLIDLTKKLVAHADFSYLKQVRGNERVHGSAITFASPEVYRGVGISFKHDSWTLGLTLASMLQKGSTMPLCKVHRPQKNARDDVSRQTLANFSSLRQRLMNDPRKGEFPAGEINRDRLNDATMLAEGGMAPHLYVMAQYDEDLTAYIVAHLLDPDEILRHSSTQAAQILGEMAAASDVEGAIRRSSRMPGQDPDYRAFSVVRQTAQVLM